MDSELMEGVLVGALHRVSLPTWRRMGGCTMGSRVG